MPAGDAFTRQQREELERVLSQVLQDSRLSVGVYVGPLAEDPRGTAQRLHAGLPVPAHAVLVAVDPEGRRVEIVTGAEVRGRLDDRSCGLAAMTMSSAFAAGDLVGGVVTGVRTLAEHASGRRQPA